MASADLRDELDCSICLSIFTDPVTLRCGHNFCRVCIDHMMDTQDGSGVYSCPECRYEFPERPALQKNITLCKIVRKFLFTQPLREATNIFCTHCVDSPVPAAKSCLHCEASLCDHHLRVHSKSAEHVLTEPSANLEDRKCPVHKKILEYYCTEDDTCICMSCSLVGEHRGHRVENLYEASEKKKKELRNALKKLTRKIQQVELRKSALSREMTHLEELCTTDNPVTVLQEPDAGGNHSEEDGDDGEHHNSHDVNLAVISGTFHADVLPFLFSKNVNNQDQNVTFYPQEPADIKLDLKTASNQLCITGNLTIAQRTFTDQNRPWNLERFKDYQALSTNRFSSGRHYWDVDVGDSLVWMVGMSYPSIGRGGIKSLVGGNNKSWGLHGYRGNTKHAVRHNGKVIQVLRRITTDRIRICLDYEAGQLSFYELCDPIKHIYTFIATFTEPLHAIICVCSGTVKILG
ncbi:E3 ubiquitin/ISG15 ligase TRIM25-like [Eleutherodactylus coqui]|uniref:E3 ubiquitin/ISG15 ligase TRIM25-like n=1 Tax=Eleutherodactylus coqui TaxID=57060 RepID=UPI003462D4A6